MFLPLPKSSVYGLLEGLSTSQEEEGKQEDGKVGMRDRVGESKGRRALASPTPKKGQAINSE